jgi:hypothetical protein
MQQLTDLAEVVRTNLNLKYDDASIKFVEGFIERNKATLPEEDWNGLINSCGAFIGQTIIENYGGKWEKEADGTLAVAFNDANKVYPFAKVRKQFDNGLEDSVYSMFTMIPIVFKMESKKKKKWWKF